MEQFRRMWTKKPWRTNQLITFCILPVLFVAGCGLHVSKLSDLPVRKNLETAERSVEVSDTSIEGDLYMWRNMMPGLTPANLLSQIKIQTADQSPLPDGLHAFHIYIIHGDQVWKPCNEAHPELNDHKKYTWMFREGPDWKTEAKVDAYISFQDQYDKRHFLQLGKTQIQKIQ